MHHGELKGNRTKHVLKILHTTEQNFGEYMCNVKNVIGQNYKTIQLTGNYRHVASRANASRESSRVSRVRRSYVKLIPIYIRRVVT